MHGHDMLFAFCRTIGKRNTRYIRRIAEHAPWAGSYFFETWDRPAHTNVTSWGRFKDLTSSMGLHEKGYGVWYFTIARTLTRSNGGISDYTLIVPDRFLLDQDRDFASTHISRSLLRSLGNSEGARVTQLELESDGEVTSPASDVNEQRLFRKSMRQEAQARGWTVAKTSYDRFGCYETRFSGVLV